MLIRVEAGTGEAGSWQEITYASAGRFSGPGAGGPPAVRGDRRLARACGIFAEKGTCAIGDFAPPSPTVEAGSLHARGIFPTIASFLDVNADGMVWPIEPDPSLNNLQRRRGFHSDAFRPLPDQEAREWPVLNLSVYTHAG